MQLPNILLVFLASAAQRNSVAEAHNGGLHGRQGFDPLPEPVLPEITGPFEVVVKVRFDDWNVGGKWQRVFDFGSGPSIDNIYLSQYRDTRRMQFQISDCTHGRGHAYLRTDGDVIDNGALVTWKVGLDPSGLMYMMKDGVMVKSMTTSCLPPNVAKTGKYLGKSHWSSDEPLHGAVLGIRVRNLPGAVSLRDMEFQNIPGQFVQSSDFTISFHARFDKLAATVNHPQGNQHVFDFAESSAAPATNQIYFSQVGETTDVEFGIERYGVLYTATAFNAIVLEEYALWHVDVDDGTMSIKKNSNLLNSTNHPALEDDLEDYRRLMLIGESSDTQNRPLDGVVLSLRVDY